MTMQPQTLNLVVAQVLYKHLEGDAQRPNFRNVLGPGQLQSFVGKTNSLDKPSTDTVYLEKWPRKDEYSPDGVLKYRASGNAQTGPKESRHMDGVCDSRGTRPESQAGKIYGDGGARAWKIA